MDEPARKRRKTSSPERDTLISPLKQPPRRPSMSARPRLAAEDGHSSPLKAPPRRFSVSPTKGAPGRSSSPLKEPPRKPPRRPSFASPTKASLARGYPDLLQRPSSPGAGTRNGRADLLARGKQARAFVLGEPHAELQIAADEREVTVPGAQSLRAPTARPDSTPRAQKARPRKEREASFEEEIDLPATQSQRGTQEQYTPRPGLFSSPSKRPPRLDDPSKKPRSPRKALAAQQGGVGAPVERTLPTADEEPQPPQQDDKQPPDPVLEDKKREKAHLERELRLLESQLSKCTEEIAKSQASSATHVGSPVEREALVKLINELAQDRDDNDDRTPAISAMLCSFLPFATQRIPIPQAPSESPVASHRPLELDDPLPYLQLFTSFEFRTKLSVPRGQNLSSSRVHQKHLIDITGPQSLLAGTVSVVIDTLSNAIVDLKILRLSHWAERELGAFMRARAKDQDLGTACWAIGSYWELSKKRAEFWHRCENAFGYLIPGKTSDDTENINMGSQGRPGRILSRKDLSRHLGRDTLVLEDSHVSLKLSWNIRFDWTGDAESEVGVAAAVPRVWREADSSGSFDKIPETFTSLLQSKGAFAATKTMVALLFSE